MPWAEIASDLLMPCSLSNILQAETVLMTSCREVGFTNLICANSKQFNWRLVAILFCGDVSPLVLQLQLCCVCNRLSCLFRFAPLCLWLFGWTRFDYLFRKVSLTRFVEDLTCHSRIWPGSWGFLTYFSRIWPLAVLEHELCCLNSLD